MGVSGQGHLGVARLLVTRKAQLDLQDILGDTALHFAAFYGNSKLVEYLLQQGADPTVKNIGGETAKDYAEGRGNSACVVLLVTRGG